MKDRLRRVEVHRLTISGLGSQVMYEQFLSGVRQVLTGLKHTIWEHRTRSYGLQEAHVSGNRIRLLFFSFTTGSRPDILDTSNFSIHANPLSESQTGVEWSHVMGGKVGSAFLLLFERSQIGLRPQTAEEYLQWLIDEAVLRSPSLVGTDLPREVALTIEAVPGPEFADRLHRLERVTKATLRTVRPNPGWADLDSELGKLASDSGANKVDVTVSPKPRGSLQKNRGILGWIKDLLRSGSLGYAAIEGVTPEQEKDEFSTSRLGLQKRLPMKLDAHGQVQHGDAWGKLGKMMDGLERKMDGTDERHRRPPGD